jgi:hypothetical protein
MVGNGVALVCAATARKQMCLRGECITVRESAEYENTAQVLWLLHCIVGLLQTILIASSGSTLVVMVLPDSIDTISQISVGGSWPRAHQVLRQTRSMHCCVAVVCRRNRQVRGACELPVEAGNFCVG